MIVYRVRYAVDDFCWYAAPDDWFAERRLIFDGHPVGDDWRVPSLFVDSPDRPEPDLASVNFAPDPVVAKSGRAFLEGELGDLVEFLSLEPLFGERWLANVTYLVDCLDEEGCDWRIGKSTGQRTSVFRFAFYTDVLASLKAQVFKIPQFPTGSLYCTDEFRDRVQASGLTGLVFEQIWDRADIPA